MTQPRRESINSHEVQIVHVFNRCVRRAFLTGIDPVTGKNYEYRKEWSRNRLKHLASCFAIDVISYAIMSNHTHQILRSRPDVVRSWSDREVVTRWLRITPRRDNEGAELPLDEMQIDSILENKQRVQDLRKRLSSISWWMRYFSQHISVRCNREDEVRGHFWESRFGHTVLEDEAAVLACMIYIDLNPVRAQMAASPEDSVYTSGYDRLHELRLKLFESGEKEAISQLSNLGSVSHAWERLGGENSGWLSPIEIDERTDPIGPDLQFENQTHDSMVASAEADSRAEQATADVQFDRSALNALMFGPRCSRKGVLPISLSSYLETLELGAQKCRSDKSGPAGKNSAELVQSLVPVLKRLGISKVNFGGWWNAIEKRCRNYLRMPPLLVVLETPNAREVRTTPDHFPEPTASAL